MEPIVEVGSLIERLNARYTVRDEFSTTHPLCNPDGPEAAAEITRLRSLLIDPGSPAWEDARAVLAAELRKAGMHADADAVAVAQPAMIQSHMVLNLIAHSRQAFQAERDKERDAVVAWLRERSVIHRSEYALSIDPVVHNIAENIQLGHHRSEHV